MTIEKWINKDGVEFKIGDKVKIVKEEHSYDKNGMGQGKVWENSWTTEMTSEIGSTYVIGSIESHGVQLKGSDYNYPITSLENLEKNRANFDIKVGMHVVTKSGKRAICINCDESDKLAIAYTNEDGIQSGWDYVTFQEGASAQILKVYGHAMQHEAFNTYARGKLLWEAEDTEKQRKMAEVMQKVTNARKALSKALEEAEQAFVDAEVQ